MNAKGGPERPPVTAGTPRLGDKVALVTGGTTGIGEAIVTEFLAEGARVMVHGLGAVAPEGFGAGRSRGEQEGTRYVGGDLSDPQTCLKAVGATVDRFGRIDILVNNAAAITRGDLAATDPALFDRTMAVNARAPMLLAQAAMTHFQRQGGGCILNIGSVNAYCGERAQVAYSMSKGALMTLSRNLADAYCAQHVRVNHLNLGWVLTAAEQELKVRDGLPEDWAHRLPTSFAPSGSLLAPSVIARFAVTYVEDATDPVSGAVVDLEQYPMMGRNPTKFLKGSADR